MEHYEKDVIANILEMCLHILLLHKNYYFRKSFAELAKFENLIADFAIKAANQGYKGNVFAISLEKLKATRQMLEYREKYRIDKERLRAYTLNTTPEKWMDWLNAVEMQLDGIIQKESLDIIRRELWGENVAETTESIIRFEFENVKDRFTNKTAFEKAISETILFFKDNNHRATTPIVETIKAKDAIILTYKAIKIYTGRASQYTYKNDTDYNAFIKSLYKMYENKTEKQIGETMEKKN